MVFLCVVGFQSEQTRVSLPRLAGWFPRVRTCCRGRRLLRSWVLGHLCHPACSSRASITLGKLTARFRRGVVSQPGVASRVSAQTCLVTSLRLIQPTEVRCGAGDTHAVDTHGALSPGALPDGSPAPAGVSRPKSSVKKSRRTSGDCALRAVQAREPSGNNQWVHAPALSGQLCECLFHVGKRSRGFPCGCYTSSPCERI